MPTFLHRERFGDFAVHPTDPKTLSVEVEPGVLLSSTGQAISGLGQDTANYASSQVLSSAQTVGPFAVPGAGNVRKDVIVIATDLTLSVLTGTPVASPGPAVAPAFPANLIPLAEISLTDVTAQIGTAEIQDVRPFLAAHQDRTRTVRIESLLPGVDPPSSTTSGNFNVTNFAAGVDQNVKFSMTIPQDFDYNRVMSLKLETFTTGAGVAAFHQWDLAIQRVALSGGSFPPAAATVKSWIFNSLDDGTYQVNEIKIADSSASSHFALRTLLPGDLLSLLLTRKGTSGSDTYTGNVSLVEVTVDYNSGSSVYPG